MSNPMDANIPVLTDVIGPPDKSLINQLVPAVAPAAAPAVAPSVTPAIASPLASPVVAPTAATASAAVISEDDWLRLEQSIRESVLKQVLARVDFVLEHRVRDSLADVLQTAVEHLATDIRAGLHKTMEEVVTRAITQEISKAKLQK